LENDRDQARRETQRLRGALSLHMLMGVAAALLAVLVNSIAVTYFIGTSRWCREVVEAYRLDPQLEQASQHIKRATFPWALGGMLTVIALVALGALADPSVFTDPANPARHLTWRTWHFVLACLGTAFIGYAFVRQAQGVGENYRVIERILAEVHRIRAERGLDTK
jgi:drug/metabolite transporter (DMT)-like permease